MRGWQPPAAAGGSQWRAHCMGAQKSRARGARAHPRITFGRSQVSPPVLAAAQPHGNCWSSCRLLPIPAGRRGRGLPAGSAQPGAGLRTELLAWPPSPSRSVLARRGGHPSSGQTLLINRRTRRSRQRRRQPAFISARWGGPARLPALAGALPEARYPGALSCALVRDRQGALWEPPLSPIPPLTRSRNQRKKGGGDTVP